MTLKNAALFALIATALLTVVFTFGFLRDFSAFLSDAIALMVLLNSAVHLLAGLSLALFFYVFYQAQP